MDPKSLIERARQHLQDGVYHGELTTQMGLVAALADALEAAEKRREEYADRIAGFVRECNEKQQRAEAAERALDKQRIFTEASDLALDEVKGELARITQERDELRAMLTAEKEGLVDSLARLTTRYQELKEAVNSMLSNPRFLSIGSIDNTVEVQLSRKEYECVMALMENPSECDLEAPPFTAPHNHVYGQNLSPSHVEHHGQIDAYKALCERYRSALNVVEDAARLVLDTTSEHKGLRGGPASAFGALERAVIASEALQPEGEK